eukprot:1179130-Prorocentrum_minimum.AAC.2
MRNPHLQETRRVLRRPRGEQSARQVCGYRPRVCGYRPRSCGYRPRGCGYRPHGCGYRPHGCGYRIAPTAARPTTALTTSAATTSLSCTTICASGLRSCRSSGRAASGRCVYKCLDHKTGQFKAVKVIRNKKRFHHQALVEVKILDHLKHHVRACTPPRLRVSTT